MTARTPRTAHRREAGSAYLLSLAALVILSIVGLSLAVITESEMLVGAGDRTRERTFYSADSGLGAATARALALAEYEAMTYEVIDDDAPSGLDIRNRIEISPFAVVLSGACNLCNTVGIGTGQGYEKSAFKKITHAVAARATREGGPLAIPISQLTISSMVDVEPWDGEQAEQLMTLLDTEELKKIKF